MKIGLVFSTLFSMLQIISCGPVTDLRNFADTDLYPPELLEIISEDENGIKLLFNENIKIGNSPVISPDCGEASYTVSEETLTVEFPEKQEPGKQYSIEASVNDEKGNSMSFIAPFYGYNPRLPEVIINEFITQGSSTHPDMVELFIKTAGNTAGMWIIEGTPEDPDDNFVFPSCEVNSGDYIIIHFKPQGIPEESDEVLEAVDESGGLDASDTARDFWVPGGGGLSGNNGVITLYSSHGGKLLDGVMYSNRTSASDEDYSGFGSSSTLEKVLQLYTEEGWKSPTGSYTDYPKPEDGINPDDSTATRSICRGSGPADTDSSADWHITPTSGSSFGAINTDAVYSP